ADGTMDTTIKIRQGATWHDGSPITAEDLIFTVQVGKDPRVGTLDAVGEKFLEQISAVESRTVAVHWNQTFVEADLLFSGRFALPLPKHILGPIYEADPGKVSDAPYWTSEFIGGGPFKVKSFDQTTSMVLVAND